MQRHLRTFLLLTQFFCFILAQTTIAVIDFDSRGISANEVATLTDRFRDELIKTNQYTVIERGKMEEVLKEQGFQQSGCISDECVVEIGQLIGVQQMVGGSIGKVGNVFSVSARIIDVQSGRIINVSTYDHTGDIGGLLTVGMRQVVTGLLSGITTSVVSPLQDFGSIYISSEPSGANVWIDGIQISGTTPTMIDNQNVGEHEILVQKGDYSARQSVTIKKDVVNKLSMVLQLGMGKLKVVSDPFEAKVFVDGVERGLTPVVISDLKAGYHDISVQLNEYSNYEQPVLIKSNTIEELDINLIKIAVVSISSEPAGAAILIDGLRKGQTPISIQISEGEHAIVLQKEGYYDYNFTITLKPGEKLTRELKLNPWVGVLVVSTSPIGAEVYINGAMKGVTPLKIDQLKTGDYTVDLKLKDYLHETRQTQMSRDGTETINVNLISVASAEQEIAGLNKRKLYYLAGSAGALASALLLNIMANNNYDEYQTAISNATELHETIDQQVLLTKVFLAVGVGGAIPAIKYHFDQTRLRNQLESSK